MLVEDDVNLREIYAARLLAEGYQVVTASDGEEALASAVKEKPDLIVLDVMMPKISGFDVLDILRSTPETKQSIVIMMTALSQQSDRERGERLGADRYLVKSQVTLEDVVNTIEELLDPNKTAQLPATAPPETSSSEIVGSGDAAAPPPVTSETPVGTDNAATSLAPTPTPADTLPPANSASQPSVTDAAVNDDDSESTDTGDAAAVEPPPTPPAPSDDQPAAEDETEADGASGPPASDSVAASAEATLDTAPPAGASSAPADAPPVEEPPAPSATDQEAAGETSPEPVPEPTPDAPQSPGQDESLTIHQPPPIQPEPSAEPTPVGTVADIENLPVPELDKSLSEDSATSLDKSYFPPTTEPGMTPDKATPDTAPSPVEGSGETPTESPTVMPAGTSDELAIPTPSFPPDEPPAPAASPINSSNPQPGETIVPTNPT